MSSPCCVVATSNAPSVKPRAAAQATSSIWAKSTSSPGPCSPKACLTTILPHCLASRLTACNSSGDNFRVAMTWPSLTLEKLGKANSVRLSYPPRSMAQRESCTQLAYPTTDVLAIIGREQMKESKFYEEVREEGRVEGL